MAIWKITKGGPEQVPQTAPKKEKLLESDLEDWIEGNPELLGEPLMIIGRQVMIPEIKDRLDILAVDTNGNAVIVELKRGKLKDPVDMQALRYASYISKWQFEDFARQAQSYLGRDGEDYNFNAAFEEFCQNAGVDDIPEVNTDQRMIVLGSAVREKLGSVALWLREHRVDIKVIEVRTYKEGDTILIEPVVIIPVPVSRFADTGKAKTEGSPWVVDGKQWHLESRCSAATRKVFLQLDDLLRDNFDVDGPRWNQKYYVAYRQSNKNWLAVSTSSQSLRLDFLVKKGAFKTERLAKVLGVQAFDREDSLAEKLNLPSSVHVKNRTETTDRVLLRIKEDFDLESEAFHEFVKGAYEAFPK